MAWGLAADFAVIHNDRGQTPTDLCDGPCGPGDLWAWYEATRAELDTAEMFRVRMTGSELAELAALERAWEALPPRMAWWAADWLTPTGDRGAWHSTAQAAANIGQGALTLWRRVAARLDQPTTTPTAPVPTQPTPQPDSGGGWSWPKIPTLPDLDFPFPDLGKALPWVAVALLVLLAWSPPARAASRGKR